MRDALFKIIGLHSPACFYPHGEHLRDHECHLICRSCKRPHEDCVTYIYATEGIASEDKQGRVGSTSTTKE